VKVDAGPVARLYRVVDGRPSTYGVSVDGHGVPVEGPEIVLLIDGVPRRDVDLVATDVEEDPDHGGLSWTLSDPDDGDRLAVRMVVEADRRLSRRS